MSIFTRRLRGVQALRRQVDEMSEELRQTRKTLALVIDDADSVTSSTSKYTGNDYDGYEEAIEELAQKYEGTADWGVLQTGAIVDVRSAFIIGEGLKVSPVDGDAEAAAREMEFADAFIEYNDLNREMVQEFAKEGEIEGCFLAELFWDEEAEMVSVRFRSRSQYNYTVKTDPRDYAWYTGVTWTDESGQVRSLSEEEFVYARFGGRVHQPNLPYPKIAKCLTQIDYLDKAIRDWREINRLFAAPKPHIQVETAQEAKDMNDAVNSHGKNWRIKSVFCHTGTLSYLSPDIQGVTSIEKEILTLAKMISGTTGVPVHFLGLPDLMSNRATADNLMELVAASTRKEREIWKGTYQQIIAKAMDIWSARTSKTALDPDLVKVEIPYITETNWRRITEVYLPLAVAEKISDQALLEQIPGLDINAEMERAEERKEESLERFREMQERMSQSAESDEGDDDDGEGDERGRGGNRNAPGRFERQLGAKRG